MPLPLDVLLVDILIVLTVGARELIERVLMEDMTEGETRMVREWKRAV
jgi:hypothetical protein